GAGLAGACLTTYVAPAVMRFPPTLNESALKAATADRERLIPSGSVHPAHAKDVKREAKPLVKAGLGGLKIHPPHQLLAPNDPRFVPLYDVAEDAGVPVMVYTGTRASPGARS